MPPVAVAIGMGVMGAGTSLVGAKVASSASKNAAKVQVAAADKAQAFNERAYADQQRALSPYMQAGQQSLGSLMSQYGGKPLQNPYAPSGVNGQGMPQYDQPPMPQGGGGMSLGAAMQGGGQQPPQPPQGGGGAPGGMVRVKAPTGEMAMLQAGSPQLQKALQAGAQVLQ